MIRKNYLFDPAKLFDYLPSIWGKNYEDKDVFEKLYGALARVTESDYASIFQVDDAKDLSTLPVLTYYPVVYEKFENWQSYGTEHAHTKIEAAFDPDITTIRAGETYYVVHIPDIYLRGDIQITGGGRLIPSDCYLIEIAPYVEWSGSPLVSTEVDGSNIYFNKTRLDLFLETVPSSNQEASQSVFSPLEELSSIILFTMKTAKPFRFIADGETSEYSLTGFDDATKLVAEDTRVLLESVVADSLFTYTSSISSATETRVYTIRPVNATGLSGGAVLKLYFQDGANLYVKRAQLPANQTQFSVSFAAGASLVGIQLLINFELGRHMVELESYGLTLKGSNVFFPGARVRVTDDTGVQSFTIDRIQNGLRFERPVDVDTVRISFLGVNILESGVLEGSIKFDGVPTSGVHVLVDASIANDHVHEHFQVTADDASPGFTTIVLPQAAPMVVDPLSVGLVSEFFPLRVCLDGQLIRADSYTIIDSITIELDTVIPNNTLIDVHYLNQEELVKHRHVVLNATVAADVPVQYSFDMGAAVDTAYYLESYIDGFNYQSTTGLYVKNSDFAYFTDGLVAGSRVSLYGTTKSYKYWHALDDRAEAKYLYTGSLIRADWLQDGLDAPAHTLAWGSSFNILIEDGKSIVQSEYAIENGWFLEAQVDERIAQTVWGDIAGLVRKSSATYNKVLAAAYAGYRSGSNVSALENFASILLGSEYLPSSGISRGITNTETGSAADIELLDKTRVQLPIDTDEPDRLLPAPKQMPRFHAINQYATVIDKNLESVPYLPWMSEEVSDFRFSKRLDSQASDLTSGQPYSYDLFSSILTDYSVDFVKEEVWVGDLIKVVLDASAGSATQTQFVKIAEVLDAHRIRVAVLLTPTSSGYGEGTFGGGVMGGGVSIPNIVSYTIWTRKTRPLDVFLRLDEALDKLQTTVAGETIQTLNLSIAEILKHFCFAVKLSWSRMTDIDRLEDLQKFINIFKPAHTKVFVYTEFLENELLEYLTVDVQDYDLDLSVAGTHEANSWRADESYFGDSYAGYTDEFDLLYNPDRYSIGPKIAAQVKRAPDAPEEGQYYLTSDVAAMGGAAPAGPAGPEFSHLWGGYIIRMFVFNSQVAWRAEEGGRIKKTLNGGQTWFIQTTPEEINSFVRGIYFLKTGAEAGQRGWAVTANGYLLGTADGGTTWTIIGSQFFYANGHGFVDKPVDLWDVVFLPDNLTGWVCGIRALLITTDGGLTWTDLTDNLSVTTEAYRFAFLDPIVGVPGLLITQPNTVYRTTDGVNWAPQSVAGSCPSLPDELELWDLQFFPSTDPATAVGFLVGGQGHQCGVIYRTEDGGQTWVDETPALLPPTLYGVTPLSDGSALLAGYAGVVYKRNRVTGVWSDITYLVEPDPASIRAPLLGASNDGDASAWVFGSFGHIYHTADFGDTWDTQGDTDEWRIRGLYFIDALRGWATTQTYVIIGTQDGGLNWVEETQAVLGKPSLNSVSFRTADIGVVVGEADATLGSTPSILYYESSVEPAGWRPVALVGAPTGVALKSVVWVGTDAWAVGTSNTVMRSTDGFGRSWSVFTGPAVSSVSFSSIAYDGVDTLYVVGADHGAAMPFAFRLQYPSLVWEDITDVAGLSGIWESVAARDGAVYVVGYRDIDGPTDAGRIYKFDLSSIGAPHWDLVYPQPGEAPPDAFHTCALAGQGSTLKLFAGGDHGAVVTYSNGVWESIRSSTNITLLTSSFLSPTSGFMAGTASLDAFGFGYGEGGGDLGESSLVRYAIANTSTVGQPTLINPFYFTFSSEHGLENTVVKVIKTNDLVEYHVDSGFGDRLGKGLRLTVDKRIRIPNWTYFAWDNVSFSTWVQIVNDDPLFSAPMLFQVGNPVDPGNPYFTVAITAGSLGYGVTFQGSGGSPIATSSQTILSGSWVFIAAVFKKVYTAGEPVLTPHIYVNGVEDIADMTGVVATDLLVPNLVTDVFVGAGAGSSVGVQVENSLDCIVDETIIWSKALTAEEVLEQYNNGSGRFSRPMGVATNTATGEVRILHEAEADVIFHYERDENSATVFDDSGNGHNGLKEGGDSSAMWAVDGLVHGPHSVGQDVHEIDGHGTYINPGNFEVKTVAFDQSTGDDTPVYNHDLQVQSVFISNSGTERLTKPNIVYTLDVTQGTWKLMSMVSPAISSAVTLLTQIDPYSGFSGGGLVDPDGNLTSQL